MAGMSKRWSEEWRAKQSAAHKGKGLGIPRSEETVAKVKEALLAKGAGKTATKRCPRCERVLPRSAFRLRPNGWSESYCVPCMSAYSAEHAVHRSKRSSESQRVRNIARYGLTVEQFDEMVAAQGGVCAICGQAPVAVKGIAPALRPARDPVLHIDHDHETGRVRGLLCTRCNSGIGFFGDNAKLLRVAVKYLTTKR